MELPYDPAIPLLGIYPEETLIQKDTHTPVFIAALFPIAKTWKQPKCPLTNEWIREMWSIYTMEYYPAIKMNEIMPFTATWMDLEILIPSEVSQTKKNLCYHLFVEHIKNGTNELLCRTETDSQTERVNLWLPTGKGGGGGIN